VPHRPELAVVVLSYRNEDTVLDAVDSLLLQDEPLEVVVSHSGGGPTPELLAARPSVPVLATPERRLPGAARNVGVAATSAPFVAFLAADCQAAPGWARGRLARHRAGVQAVASALLPADRGVCARASWLVEHSTRLPVPACPDAGLHGVSYARELLERHGPFQEDMRVGEDTRLNERLAAAQVEIEWAPDVLTLHRYPTSPLAAVAEGYRRGARRALARRLELSTPYLVWSALRATPRAAQRAWPRGAPVGRGELVRAIPLMAACSLAKATGAVVARG
jgi:glycosyltransferase involved in cell wall biosynthesis